MHLLIFSCFEAPIVSVWEHWLGTAVFSAPFHQIADIHKGQLSVQDGLGVRTTLSYKGHPSVLVGRPTATSCIVDLPDLEVVRPFRRRQGGEVPSYMCNYKQEIATTETSGPMTKGECNG